MGDEVAPNQVSEELRGTVRQLDEFQNARTPLAREVLLAYHLGELSESEAEAVRERIPWDDQALAYLATLRDPDITEESHRSESEIAEDWKTLEGLIASTAETAKDASRPKPDVARKVETLPRKGSPHWLNRPMPFQLLAAGLTLVCFGLWWQLDQTQGRIRHLIEPRPNPVMVDLIPSQDLGSTRDPLPGIDLPLAKIDDTLVLVLNYTDFQPLDAYHGELLPIDGNARHSMYRFERLKRAEDGSFQIVLHRDWIVPGGYEIQLAGVSNGTEELLATYRFSVSAE